jgi:hypothetical protein
MRTPEQREAAREAKAEARRLAGTTRHLELPVPPDEALSLIKEAAELRKPMMRLLRYRGDTAEVSVAGSFLGSYGTFGGIGAAGSMVGAGIGVKVSWAPHGEGTQYTAYAPTVAAMLVLRTEIHSLWRALEDAWDARMRWEARKHP